MRNYGISRDILENVTRSDSYFLFEIVKHHIEVFQSFPANTIQMLTKIFKFVPILVTCLQHQLEISLLSQT